MRYARFVCRREAESLSGPNDLPVSIKEKRARIVVAVLTRTAKQSAPGLLPAPPCQIRTGHGSDVRRILRLAVHDCDDPSQ